MDAEGLSRPNHSSKLSRQLDSLTYWNIVISPSGLFALSSRVEIAHSGDLTILLRGLL